MTEDSDLQAAIAGELRLLLPSVRKSAAAVEALLDPGFVEFGASGRRWERHEILDALAADTDYVAPMVHDLAATRLADGLVQIVYLSDDGRRRCRRSSIWRLTSDGWRVLFHQGTLIPPD